MNERRKFGIYGEKIASNYLEREGYKILERNYIPKWRPNIRKPEIDIIVKKKDVIVFVEVKTIIGPSTNFFPEDKVDSKKQKKIIKTAHFWLMEKKIPPNSKWQIDVIAVEVQSDLKTFRIRHIKNAISDRP